MVTLQKILANTEMEELMKDIHTLLKRKEALNNRDALSTEDIKKYSRRKRWRQYQHSTGTT